MALSGPEQDADRKIERAFENLAEELDDIASTYSLNNTDMLALVHDWDLEEYYREWMNEGWEPVNDDVRA